MVEHQAVGERAGTGLQGPGMSVQPRGGLAPAGDAAIAASDVRSRICSEIAGTIKRAWGRGPRDLTAHWAGANMLVVLLEDRHTEHERTLRHTGHCDALLDGRTLLQDILEGELEQIVGAATGRTVITTLAGTRLSPDLSFELFVLEPSDTQQGSMGPA